MTSARAKPPGGLTSIDLGVLAALLIVAIFIGTTVVKLPSVVGAYLDDGVYLVTARSIADGTGYRHLELPGEPNQTKYPFLYPLLLSVVWLVAPDFPANIPIVQVLNVVLWALGSWLAYLLMRRAWGLPWWLPACGAILAFANPTTITILRTAFSESLYLLASMGALALAVWSGGEKAGHARQRMGSVGAGFGSLLAGHAYLTRSVGLAMVVAILVDLLLKRRWRQLILAAAVAGVTVGGWQWWRSGAVAENASNPAYHSFRYDLDYGAWLPSDAGTLAWVVYNNVSSLGMTLFEEIAQTPTGIVEQVLGKGPGAGLPLYAGALLVNALLLIGLLAVWQWAQPAIHVYLVSYLGLVLIWPYPPVRFLAPVFPIVATLFLAGVYAVVARVARLLSGKSLAQAPPPAGHTGIAPRWAVTVPGANAAFKVMIVAALLLGYVRFAPLISPDEQTLQTRANLAAAEGQRADLAELLRDNTLADAVISARFGGCMHLMTGRKFVQQVPSDDAIAVYYPDDRPFWGCGRVVTEQMRAADKRFVDERLVEHLNATGATHVVPVEVENTYYRRVFDRLVITQPNSLQLIGRVGPFSLYRISGPLR